jgi:hypothetical protein
MEEALNIIDDYKRIWFTILNFRHSRHSKLHALSSYGREYVKDIQ